MNRNSLKLLLLLSTLAFLPMEGSVLEFQHLTVKKGLLSKKVNSFATDHNQFIWLAQDNGLARYDGNAFTYFFHDSTENSLHTNKIRRIVAGNNHDLWIGTDQGVDHYSIEHNQFTHYNKDTIASAENSITSILLDTNGLVWYTDYHTLYQINHKTSKQKRIPLNTDFPELFISHMHYDKSSHTLYFGSWLVPSLFEYDISKKTLKEYKMQDDCLISQITISPRKNTLLLACNNDLFYFDIVSKQSKKLSKEHEWMKNSDFKLITTLFLSPKNGLWVGTAKGLFHLDFANQQSTSYFSDPMDPNSISNNGIIDISHTHDGVLWISTGEGIDYTRLPQTGTIQNASQDNQLNKILRQCYIENIYVEKHQLWIATREQGIIHYQAQQENSTGENIKFLTYESGQLPSNHALSFLKYKNTMYCGTMEGLVSVDLNTFHLTNIKDFSGLHIYAIQEHESILYLSSSKGLFSYNPENSRIKSLSQHFHGKMKEAAIRTLVFAGEILIIGTESQGMLTLNTKTGAQHHYQAESIGSNNIRALLIGKKNDFIWIGHLDGLTRYDFRTGNFYHYQGANSMNDYAIIAIEEDDRGQLWMTTRNYGLIRFNPLENEWEIFDENTSSLPGTFADNASFIDQEGHIYFSGTKGIIKINTTQTQRELFSYPLHLTSIEIRKEQGKDILLDVPNNEPVSVPHGDHTLVIGYSLLTYSLQDNVKYAYKLEGLEDEWNYADNKKRAIYTNLPPGKYNFQVKSALGMREYAEAETLLQLEIPPPYYQSIWFRSLFILIAAALVYFFYKRRVSAIKATNNRLEYMVNKRTQEVEDQKTELQIQQEELQRNSTELFESLSYAKNIQDTILPPATAVQNMLGDHLIFFKPKTIVSGDFYWVEKANNGMILDFEQEQEQEAFFSAIDCTGHGVPGAFMSILGYMALSQALKEHQLIHPDEILNYMNEEIKRVLRGSEKGARDGMDIALCKINKKNMTLEYAGAMNDLYLIRNGELIVYRSDHYSIGGYRVERPIFFKNNVIHIQQDDMIYLCSDGFQDQIGGERNKRYSRKRFRELLLSLYKMTLEEQQEALADEFASWMGDNEQMDDVLIFAVKIT